MSTILTASAALPLPLPGLHPWTPLGDFRPLGQRKKLLETYENRAAD